MTRRVVPLLVAFVLAFPSLSLADDECPDEVTESAAGPDRGASRPDGDGRADDPSTGRRPSDRGNADPDRGSDRHDGGRGSSDGGGGGGGGGRGAF